MLAVYLTVINVVSFCLFGLDKRRARHGGRRIPERHLLLAALAGGTAGALVGMYLFHHKTLHRRFTTGLPLLLLGQVCAAVLGYWKY